MHNALVHYINLKLILRSILSVSSILTFKNSIKVYLSRQDPDFDMHHDYISNDEKFDLFGSEMTLKGLKMSKKLVSSTPTLTK